MILLKTNINENRIIIKNKLLKCKLFYTFDDITFYTSTPHSHYYIKEKRYIFNNKV